MSCPAPREERLTSLCARPQNLFRSDVLVTFHPPIFVSARTHPDLISTPALSHPRDPSQPPPPPDAHERAIRSLTASIGASIRSGILDAPSWAVIRIANTARRLYAPLGTRLTLGDHVRLTQRFVDALAGKRAEKTWEEMLAAEEDEQEKEHARAKEKEKERKGRPGMVKRDTGVVWKTPMRETKAGEDYFAMAARESGSNGDAGLRTDDDEDGKDELVQLRKDLKTYQVRLSRSFSRRRRLQRTDLGGRIAGPPLPARH